VEQAGSGGFVEEDLVDSDLSRRRITDEVQRRRPGRLELARPQLVPVATCRRSGD